MSDLPSGTVTFLLTDIEGSTALWEQFPVAMQDALQCHDEIMSTAIPEHGGSLIKSRGEGDSVFTVFAQPADAVRAAIEIQLSLHHEEWALPDPLRVRVAIHTGQAELRGGDYFGPTVNRCARLRAVAHGGQIVISSATADLVRDTLPDRASLLDLGRHRLRDLTEPEHIYQLNYADLPLTFPPLRSLDQRRHNLPQQTVPLVGREHELASIKDRLISPDVRLLTLTGPGGIGKTRLGLQVAADLIDEFTDGVYFVGLASVADSGLVIGAIAQELGVRESSGRSVRDVLSDYLRGKRLLLVLDNFEQVLPAAADVAALLAVSTGLKMLVTSRSVLHVTGEHVFPVPTLQLPPDGSAPALDALAEYEAIRLFVERARAVKPDFALTPDNAEAVRTICEHLDGLPLAIELAAARVRLLSPQAMVRRLSNALPLLTSGARDVPTRQQTLRSAIAWSYDLLDAPARGLFRRLSVFAGGSTLDAIETVVGTGDGDLDDVDLLDGIGLLLDASLLEQREMDDGEPRFRMLEVIREFGGEQLVAHGEAELMRRRHSMFFLALAESAEPHLQGPDQKTWFARLQADHDNLRASLLWFRSQGDFEHYLRLAGSLFWFWFGHGYWSEALGWYQDGIGQCPDRTAWRAKALYGAGLLSRANGAYDQARGWFNESIAISRELGDQRMVARGLHLLGGIETSEGNASRAREVLDESLAIARTVDDGWTIAVILRDLGALASQDGDVDTARRFLEESVQIHRTRGERWAQAHAQNALGDFMRSLAMYEQAGAAYEESLRIFTSLGTKDGRPSVLHNLAYVALNQGELQRAGALFREALTLFRDLGDQRGIAECLAGFAGVLSASGELRQSAWLFGAAQAVLDTSGTQISPSNMTDYGRNLVSVSLALDDAEYSESFDEGRSAPVESALALVLDHPLLTSIDIKEPRYTTGQ